MVLVLLPRVLPDIALFLIFYFQVFMDFLVIRTNAVGVLWLRCLNVVYRNFMWIESLVGSCSG